MSAGGRVDWLAQARVRLDDIAATIGLDNPRAGARLFLEILGKAQTLSLFPRLYRASSSDPDLREMVVRRNYIVLYRVIPDGVQVVDIRHARQQRPATVSPLRQAAWPH